MITRPTRDQAIALSAIFQACTLVDDLGRSGSGPSNEMKTCMMALLEQNPESASALYGGVENLQRGIKATKEHLTARGTDANSNVLRYVLSVLHLAQRLKSNPQMLTKVAEGIEKANRQAQHFSVTHDNVYANVADLYQQTISTYRYRIQVNGIANHLQQPAVANRIRCMLFSAIRSAFLWRQLGGKRYHLLIFRKRILRILEQESAA